MGSQLVRKINTIGANGVAGNFSGVFKFHLANPRRLLVPIDEKATGREMHSEDGAQGDREG